MLKVNVVSAIGYTGKRKILLDSAVTAIEKTINSDEFKTEVLSKNFSFKKNWFKSFEKYTNKEVYDLIMLAQEVHGDQANSQIDLHLKVLEEDGGKVYGYGNPEDEMIFTYRSFLDDPNTTVGDYANHIVHEWSHKIGFEHAFSIVLDPNWLKSVPYAVGNLVQKLIEKNN